MSIGSFTILKNESSWIAAHILRVLPYLDEMCFYDGNSTDGTLDIIEAIKSESPEGRKIKLFRNCDPADLKDDYVRLFNECLRSLSTDLAIFLHPDMHVVNPARLLDIKASGAVALTTSMRSFAGEPDGPLFEIVGRQPKWKNIFRLRNPDLGAHYYGHYGVHNEDVYFQKITGDEHIHYGEHMDLYPYEVEDSGLEILHFSDVRPYARRLERMRTCMKNQGNNVALAETHPRVTLKPGDFKYDSFSLVPAEYPAEMLAARNKYRHLERTLVKA